MCRWTLGTVERRCGVLLDPNSGVVDRGRGFLFKPLPSGNSDIPLLLFSCTNKRTCGDNDDDVFYLFLQKQKIGAELHIYLEEGTYHKRLFRGPNTNDMKK